MDSRTEKRVAEAHEAIDSLVETLRLDAEQHDFRIAQLVHEVKELRTENEALKYQVELLQSADAAKKAEKAAKKAAKAQAQAKDVDAP